MPPSPRFTRGLIKTNIHLSTLQLITSLLLTPMLLWHISTITLVENYQMPTWWVRDFLAEQANAWRVAVWVVACIFVPLDCAHALAVLDYWCWILQMHRSRNHVVEKGEMDRNNSIVRRDHERTLSKDEEADRQQHSLDYSVTDISSTSRTLTPRAPSTYHPLLQPRFSYQTRILLLTAFDITTLAILAAHTTTYFASLRTALAFCTLPGVLNAPAQLFGEEGILLTVRERCVGLNVDIHVAGGFAVFMALVVGALHIAALGVRGGECIACGRESVAGTMWKGDGGGRRDELAGSKDSIPSSGGCGEVSRAGSAHSAADSRTGSSIGVVECSTGIRYVNWSDERSGQMVRRRIVLSNESDASEGVSKWGEVFLECLIDA